METTRIFLKEQGYIPNMLGKSRFNCRQHRMADLFITIFDLLAACWIDLNEHSVYVLDSFPIADCDNCRVSRSRRYRGLPSQQETIYLRLEIPSNGTGNDQPVEFFLASGSWSDTKALKMYRFDLPGEVLITGDKTYDDYEQEDMMKGVGLNLLPLRKKNSHRSLPSGLTFLLSCCRKIIETTGSLIERLLPKHIHAVTARGFEIKVAFFVIAAFCNAF